MFIQVNFNSGLPPYLQIVEQVKYAAASGALQPGEALPSIRPLAERLRVNRNTVAKAYTELERQAVIETRAGKGCFLTHNSSPLKKTIRQQILREKIDDAIVQAHHFQIGNEEFIRYVQARLDHFTNSTSPTGAKQPKR